MDISPPRLRLVEVWGSLDFAQNFSSSPSILSLQAVSIHVRGTFSVMNGSAGLPYQGRAEIVLLGAEDNPGMYIGLAQYGPKLLLVLGHLQLRGEPRGTSRWMWLKSHALKDQKDALIADAAGWLRSGDRVVLAPTGVKYDECDEATVALAVDEGGDQRVTFVQKLRFTHASTSVEYNNKRAVMRGEVLLLSSNVVVRGGRDTPRCKQPRPQLGNI